MAEIELHPLRGRNPGGFLAALGALDVAQRTLTGRIPTLRWSTGIDPYAILDGTDGLDHLVELCLGDIGRWTTSPVLQWPSDSPLDDLKMDDETLRGWIDAVADTSRPEDMSDLRLQAALVAEGGRAGKGDSKPSHLHFTAGQQRFLVMVRQLRDGLTELDMREALAGPWRYQSELPVLGWDARGERIHALSGPAPSAVKKTGVPAAEWLGFLGLRFLPVSVRAGEILTTGCSPGWKRGTFMWPLWEGPCTAAAVALLLGLDDLDRLSTAERRAMGVHSLLTAPIRRTDQGGYGSFGPSSEE